MAFDTGVPPLTSADMAKSQVMPTKVLYSDHGGRWSAIARVGPVQMPIVR